MTLWNILMQICKAKSVLHLSFIILADLILAGIDEVVLIVNGARVRASEIIKDKRIDSIIIAKIEKLIFENKIIYLI